MWKSFLSIYLSVAFDCMCDVRLNISHKPVKKKNPTWWNILIEEKEREHVKTATKTQATTKDCFARQFKSIQIILFNFCVTSFFRFSFNSKKSADLLSLNHSIRSFFGIVFRYSDSLDVYLFSSLVFFYCCCYCCYIYTLVCTFFFKSNGWRYTYTYLNL